MPTPKKYPIKADLFRFVTMRSPDQLNQENAGSHFILHPDIAESAINSCPLPPTTEGAFNDYLDSFNPVTGFKQIRAVNPFLYDLINSIFRDRKKVPVTLPEPLARYRISPQQRLMLWEQVFHQILSRKSAYTRQAAIQMLIGDHLIENWDERETPAFELMIDAKLVIPQEAIQCLKPWIYRECSGETLGVKNLGIADFRKVEQEVCCYVPGEVSHIENVMAREYKERSTRNLVRSEQTFEVTSEVELEKLTDVTTATRNEITTEITAALEESSNAGYGGTLGVSGKIMGATVEVDAYADFASANSSAYSNSTAQTHAQEITRRALERLVQKTMQKRTSTLMKEFEENNKHGFDNRGGDEHVTGVYRWVDIIYKNRLVNYGKRLMIEFMVPEPAQFYKRVKNYKPETAGQEEEPETDAPKKLSDFGINGPGDITSEIAFDAASYYGVTVNPLPAAQVNLTKSLAPMFPVKHERYTQSQSFTPITVPVDYEADTVVGSYTYEYRANSATSSALAFCDYTFGGVTVASTRNYSASKTTKTVAVNINFSPNLTGNIPVSVAYSGMYGSYGAVTIKCVLKASVISDWQANVFNMLTTAYNQKQAEHEALQAQEETEVTETASEQPASNPFWNRITEQRELKRACIELLAKPFCRKQGEDLFEDLNACDKYQIPQIKQNAAYEKYASQVKFFEQAFDWKLVSYLFYPYYWADKCDWADLMKSESDDAVFQAFLQAGMARVVVPVRPQFNEAVMYYLETGDIWLGGDLVPGTDDDLYLSIVEELSATEEGVVEEEWETRVPTTLAIIQNKSAKLLEDALPCCDDVENEETTTNIEGAENVLQNILPEGADDTRGLL